MLSSGNMAGGLCECGGAGLKNLPLEDLKALVRIYEHAAMTCEISAGMLMALKREIISRKGK